MSAISRHKFVPGYSGMSCDHMYINSSGDPAQCGYPGEDPIHIKNKEITMPQQADEVHELPLHAAAQQQVEQENNVKELIDGRVALYGEPVEGFKRIAQVWSGILGTEVSATDVCLCMIGMKAVRANVSPDYSDNTDDIEGYRDIYLKIMGDDMIQARTGAEYWAEKKRRG